MNEKRIRTPLNYLYIALLAVIPWSLALMQIFLALICAYLVMVSLVNRKLYLKYHRFYLLPALFLVLQIAAALLSTDNSKSLDNAVNTFWVILTVPFIVSMPAQPVNRMRAFNALIISSSIVGVYGVIQFFTGINLTGPAELSLLGNHYRAVGTYSHFLTFSGNQLMIFAFAFTFAMLEKSKTGRILYGAATLAILMSLFATQGRGSWLGAVTIIVLGTILFFRQYRLRIVVTGAVVFMITMIFLPDIRDRFLNIFNIFHLQNQGRLSLWHSAALMIADHPWFGIGPGLFDQMLDLYRVNGFYNATGHAHNDYLHVAVQSGLPSLAVWISIWIYFFMICKKYLAAANDGPDRKIVSGALLSIAGILTASFTQCYFFDMENNILWWVIVASVLQIIGSPENDPVNTHSRP